MHFRVARFAGGPLRAAILGLALIAPFVPAEARAGGFDVPDNGAQALARGATFVAKADDPTAIYYNPAGLAHLRGYNLLVDANIYLHSFTYQRAGKYVDSANDSNTPWGQKPYPPVSNTAGPFPAPFAVLTADFGSDRLTVAAGIFGPPDIGNRTFPISLGAGDNAVPSPGRYDFVQSRSLIYFPTGAIAYRITPTLDLGVSGHLVLARLAQTSISYADAAPGQCANFEYQPCDSQNDIDATATSFGATAGLLYRPKDSLQLGLSVRTPIALDAAGVITPQPPRGAQDLKLEPSAASVSTSLPLIARAGARLIEVDGNFEVYDLELDATYEAWAAAQSAGIHIQVPNPGEGIKPIDTYVIHGYQDTFSVRAGGAYNIEVGSGGSILSLRGGGFFDSSATPFQYTRIDFDTLAKVAGTFGFGYKTGSFTFDVAYAAIASVPRTVGTGIGQIRPINGTQGGKSIDSATPKGNALPPINEGSYRGFTNTFSVGVTVSLDGLFGSGPRVSHYGNPYESNYLPAGQEPVKPKTEEEKKEETKPKPPKDEDIPPGMLPPAKGETPPPDKPPEKKKDWWEE